MRFPLSFGYSPRERGQPFRPAPPGIPCGNPLCLPSESGGKGGCVKIGQFETCPYSGGDRSGVRPRASPANVGAPLGALFTLTPGSSPGQALALSRRGFFAQLDIGAVTRPNRRLVPVCPTRWIPAYAGMTVVVAGMTVVVQSTRRGRGDATPLTAPLGSRLRGNDGECAGMTGDAFNALPPGASPAVASLPRPLRFAKGTVSSEPLITQIFADGL